MSFLSSTVTSWSTRVLKKLFPELLVRYDELKLGDAHIPKE
jgi:hypothetical protein